MPYICVLTQAKVMSRKVKSSIESVKLAKNGRNKCLLPKLSHFYAQCGWSHCRWRLFKVKLKVIRHELFGLIRGLPQVCWRVHNDLILKVANENNFYWWAHTSCWSKMQMQPQWFVFKWVAAFIYALIFHSYYKDSALDEILNDRYLPGCGAVNKFFLLLSDGVVDATNTTITTV